MHVDWDTVRDHVCRLCRQGRYNLDPDVKFFATPPVHGSLARYVDHPADFCFKMPDSLSYEQGAMVEPLSNAGLPASKSHHNQCVQSCLLYCTALPVSKHCKSTCSGARPLLAHQKHDGALSPVITRRAWQLLCKCAIRQTVFVVWWVYPSAACLSLRWCSTCMQKRRSGSRQEGGHPWSRPHRYALLPGSYIVQI